MAQRIQLRRGTATRWTTVNPTLASAEIGYETDTSQFKIGDGVTPWASLPYFSSGGGGGGGGGAGGASGLGPWVYQNNTAASDPGTGGFRMDTTTLSTVTELYLNDLNGNGVDGGAFLGLLQAGDLLYIQHDSDATEAALFEVAGTTDNGGWWTISVVYVDEGAGGIWSNGDTCIFTWFQDPPSAEEIEFTPDGDISADNIQDAVVEVRDDTDAKLADKLTAADNLSDVVDPVAARINLGVDPAGTDNSTPVTLTGESYLSLSGQELTADPIDVTEIDATGTPDNTTYLRGDGTWQTPSGQAGPANTKILFFGQSQVTGDLANLPSVAMPFNPAIKSYQSGGSSRTDWAGYSYVSVDPNDVQSPDFLSDRPYSGMILGGAGNIGYSFLNALNEYDGRDGYMLTTHMGLFGFGNWEPNLAASWGDGVTTIDHVDNLAPLALADVPGGAQQFDVVIMALGDTDVINDRGIADSVARFHQIRDYFISQGYIKKETPWFVVGKYLGVESPLPSQIFEQIDYETPVWVRTVDTTEIDMNTPQPDIHYSGDGLIEIGEILAESYLNTGDLDIQKPAISHTVTMGKSALSGEYTISTLTGPSVPDLGEVALEVDGGGVLQSIQLSRLSLNGTNPNWRYVEEGKAFILVLSFAQFYRFTVDSVVENSNYFDIQVTQTGQGTGAIPVGALATVESTEQGMGLPSDPESVEFYNGSIYGIPTYRALSVDEEAKPPGSTGTFAGASNIDVVASEAGGLYRSVAPASEGSRIQTVGDGPFNGLFARQYAEGDVVYIDGLLLGKNAATEEILAAKFDCYAYVASSNGFLTFLNGSELPTIINELDSNPITVNLGPFASFAGILSVDITIPPARSGDTWEWNSFFRSYIIQDA